MKNFLKYIQIILVNIALLAFFLYAIENFFILNKKQHFFPQAGRLANTQEIPQDISINPVENMVAGLYIKKNDPRLKVIKRSEFDGTQKYAGSVWPTFSLKSGDAFLKFKDKDI